ncbi:hypothetical protein BC937DRAFT_92978 [Endogone sp. FLAS-F59071]|nr:hypothetical protein BC937DRAFT_92978 [Endogone sp. FLAS-F59071]|eukprot:RUS15037.1 hypothetical protein BC937DRAFT_92978 [Endogone sp. FLAS-F59071]
MSNIVSLFCLVRGESPQRAFKVRISKHDNVSDLKDLIKEESQNDFRDIDARNLTLWKVNIPIPTDDDEKEVLANLTLEDNEEEGVQELVPTWKIRNAFPGELEEDTIHIIVKLRTVPRNFLSLLSESDFLELCPPSLGYRFRISTGTTTTNSTYARTPQSVVAWDDFEDNDLQGDCIPRFKGAGYTAGGLFAIATDIVGTPLEDTESLSDQERLVIQTALSSIHRHGFVHNDIRKDNILIKRNGSQFYASFIDFAFSKRGSRRDFQNEMRLLRQL